MNKFRGRGQRFLDFLFFPLRALFIPEKPFFGLTSLRDERMEVVAKHAYGRVLDVGCGPGNYFVNKWAEAGSVGVDVFLYEGEGILSVDMTKLPFPDAEFDCVTLVAVGGHIPKKDREAEFSEFSRVLKNGGRLIMTEGEPVTQTVGHIWRHFAYALVGKKDMDSERGMEHDEEYCMPRAELLAYLGSNGLVLEHHSRFMWGLNNVYVARKVVS